MFFRDAMKKIFLFNIDLFCASEYMKDHIILYLNLFFTRAMPFH